MIDTHCHLTHAKFHEDAAAVVGRAREAGVQACVTIGTGVDDGKRAAALVESHPGFVFASAGIDPFTTHRLGEGFPEELRELEELLGTGSFCALGEIGLDYHYELDPAPVQIERFESQLDLAVRCDLPVVIHVREAHADMAEVLARHPASRGVIHSFTGGPTEAAAYLELGWDLAFNGVITFKNATDVRAAAKVAPADRLLVETDSPYLAPVPHRGRRCEPAYVAHTLKAVAEARSEPAETLAEITTANARRLFGLPA